MNLLAQITKLLEGRLDKPPGYHGSLYDLQYQKQHRRTSLRGIRGCADMVPTGERLRICVRPKGHEGDHAVEAQPIVARARA